jgi:hypothetical protein
LDQTSNNGIVLDVISNALKFLAVTNQMIVALILPKWLARPLQDQVRTSGRSRLERA